MNPTLWVLVAIKIFVIFWLIYYIFERRKRKASVDNLVVAEQGTVTAYAGAPVTQIPKDYNAYNQQQLYPPASATTIPNLYPSIGIVDAQSNMAATK
ncbi:uncharacterized protein LOC119614150 [Lucilia sericata]|uniref:uncharacterized protein LOC119614150 n=1 Tax=Lucilia sericata TaxID=13632 RepID=UPI0018A82208|nr:uncharacterized protein LOC119614150 [Lucilia sericata]